MVTPKKSTKKVEGSPKVLNAFDAYFATKKAKDESTVATNPKGSLKKQSLRDESITKVCAACGKEYHPTRNGYAHVSKYCSQKCTMDKVSGRFTLN